MSSNRESENMLKLKGKTLEIYILHVFGIDGCSRSSLEVLKTDRTFGYYCSLSQKLRNLLEGVLFV